MSEHKLGSGVNWQGEIKQKRIKQTDRRARCMWNKNKDYMTSYCQYINLQLTLCTVAGENLQTYSMQMLNSL